MKKFVVYFIKMLKMIARVFRSQAKKPDLTNKMSLLENIKSTFGDQKGQVDFLINNVFDYEKKGLAKSGFFVDLGCADGITINNTYFLERYLGWNGILFEPNPAYKNNIQKFLEDDGMGVCELMLDHEQDQSPKAINRRKIDGTSEPTVFEDMYPFLDEGEVKANMLPPISGK